MTLPTSRLFAITSLALAITAGASFVHAQGSLTASVARDIDASVTVRASKAVLTATGVGGVITTPFIVSNTSADSVVVTPRLYLPAGWRIASAVPPSILAAAGSDLWLVSVVPPAGVAAGRYVIHADMAVKRVGVTAQKTVWGVVEHRDSVVVVIAERRELDIRAVSTPGFVVAGASYNARFVVRNRGNVATRVAIRGKTNHGNTPSLDVSEIDLAPGATRSVTASVSVGNVGTRSLQDLLEIAVVTVGGDTAHAEASVETTILPPAGKVAAAYWSVPGEVAFRAAQPGTGVSPFVAYGSGRLSEKSNTSIEFSLRGATGIQSVFSERDEYRVSVRNERAGIRLGDDSYGFSALTSNGSQGTGAELRGSAIGLVGGAYLQRNRWNASSPTEVAAMIGTSPRRAASMSFVMLERGKSGSGARVMAASAGAQLFGARLELEAAKSDSQLAAGVAGTARLFGATPAFTYDIGAQTASTGFAGAQRASIDEHATVAMQPIGPLMLTASASMHTMNPTALSGGFGQRTATSSLAASLTSGTGIEFERFERDDQGTVNPMHGVQQSLRLRTRLHAGRIDLLGSVQRGVVTETDSINARSFTSANASARLRVGAASYLSIFTDMTDGMALGSSGAGTMTGGTAAELRLPYGMSLRVTGSATAQRDRMADWAAQSDITLEHNVRQAIVALRGRMAQSGSKTVPATNAFFIEVRTPLHVRTSRLTVGGRAHAQVVDAATGKGVGGALVRVGNQAAMTDRDGNADFMGLQAGEYHAIVESGIAAGLLVSGGNGIRIVAGAERPVDFQMNVARGGRIMASLRQYASNRTPGPAADSMVDIGPVGQVIVGLISTHDTLWQSSDDRGRIDFGSVAPGQYTIAISATDVPEYYAFEHSTVDVLVGPGEQREIELRLVPQQRAVQFIGAETTLIAAPPTPAVIKPRSGGAKPMAAKPDAKNPTTALRTPNP